MKARGVASELGLAVIVVLALRCAHPGELSTVRADEPVIAIVIVVAALAESSIASAGEKKCGLSG